MQTDANQKSFISSRLTDEAALDSAGGVASTPTLLSHRRNVAPASDKKVVPYVFYGFLKASGWQLSLVDRKRAFGKEAP